MDSSSSRVDRAALRERLLAEFLRTVDDVADAVDQAPAGRIIRAWEYTLARLNSDELTVRHGADKVWHVEPTDFAEKRPNDDYVLFKIYDDEVQR
ncbi:MAG TPA: hypothetical protein VG826_10305 [Pirellulales bacterium]|nr:hypothetical protein [Pirellulales bacterium]